MSELDRYAVVLSEALSRIKAMEARRTGPRVCYMILDATSAIGEAVAKDPGDLGTTIAGDIQTTEGGLTARILERPVTEGHPDDPAWARFAEETPDGWFPVVVSLGEILNLGRCELAGTGFDWFD